VPDFVPHSLNRVEADNVVDFTATGLGEQIGGLAFRSAIPVEAFAEHFGGPCCPYGKRPDASGHIDRSYVSHVQLTSRRCGITRTKTSPPQFEIHFASFRH
jgi:hypothetical protein